MILQVLYDDSVDNAPSGFRSALDSVVAFFQTAFHDPVTITIAVGYGEIDNQPMDPGALAESLTNYQSYSYSAVKSALTADSKSADDVSAVASLPNYLSDGGSVLLTQAQAKALGLPTSGEIDGYVGFVNGPLTFDYNPGDGVSSGQYDFFGAAVHEITEVMGRQLQSNGFSHNYALMDLLHFVMPGQHEFRADNGGYFSIDNGLNNLGSFNTDPNGDFGDWASSVGFDSFRAFIRSGVANPVSQNDVRVMDAIGWDVADTSPPELLSTSPAQNGKILITSDISLTFTENVTVGSGNLEIHRSSDNSTVASIAITDISQVSISGSTVTFNPKDDLAPGTDYYVTLDDGAVEDIAGNIFGGISSSSDLRFTTLTLPTLSIIAPDPAISEGNSGTTIFAFEVSRSGETGIASTVHWAVDFGGITTANPSDFSGPTSGDLTFAPNDVLGRIELNIVGDTVYEPDESFTVDLSSPTGATIKFGSAIGGISNDDPGPVLSISATDADKLEGNGGTTPFTFQVTHTGDSSVDSTVHWALGFSGNPAADAFDFSGATSGDLNFAAGDTSPNTITLNVIGDGHYESQGLPEHFSVTLSSATGATLDAAHTVAFGAIQNDDARAVSDFNADGNSDLLWQQDTGQPMIWEMNGSSVLSAGNIHYVDLTPTDPGLTWHLKGADDFNGDGTADVLWQNDDGKPAIWLINGLQLTTGGHIHYVDATPTDPGTTWHIKGSGDFNSDGNADILWQNDNGKPAIWLINGFQLTSGGNIHYVDATPTDPGPTWHIEGAADFNGDGNADVLWQNDAGQTAIWLVNGFQLSSGGLVHNPDASPASLGAGWHLKGTGDFDGDGKSDIVWQNDDGRAAIWLIDGFTLVSSTVVGANPGVAWHVEGAGDYHGDGKADILWQNDSGQAMAWFMNGTTVVESDLLGSNPGPSWHLDWV